MLELTEYAMLPTCSEFEVNVDWIDQLLAHLSLIPKVTELDAVMGFSQHRP